MFCSTCGLSYNTDFLWGQCPHPALHDPDAVKQIMKFSERNTTEVPLLLGADFSDPTKIFGKVALSAHGRSFFNNKNPLPLQLSMAALEVGDTLIPVSFSITHPPIDPVFGDVRR